MGAEDGHLVEVEARAPKKVTPPPEDRPKGKKHAARTPEPIQTGRVTAIFLPRSSGVINAKVAPATHESPLAHLRERGRG